MPKSETSNPIDGPSYKAPRYRPNWFAAVICFFLGAYLLAALLTYEPSQSTFMSSPGAAARGHVGWLGANTVWILLFTVGASTWLMPVFLLWMVIVAVRNARHLASTRVMAMIVATISLSGLSAMIESIKRGNYFPQGPGGLVGDFLYQQLLADALGPFGTGLLLGTVYLFALLFIFTKDIGTEIEKIFAMLTEWRENRAKRKADAAAKRQKEKEEKARAKLAGAKSVTTPPTPIGPTGKKVFVPKSTDEPLA